MKPQTLVYDFAGIGIGPFNLGLAALTAPVTALKGIFFDTQSQFSWHPGMLLPFSKMQVPFMADLVTGADPTSPYSFLAYLKRHNRLYQFAILEDNYVSRKEYAAYCAWVAAQLPSLLFGHTVVNVRYLDFEAVYVLEVKADDTIRFYHARHIIIGIGSVPTIPPGLELNSAASILHSAQYLHHKASLLCKRTVTVIGSGQSAAEIFYDLLSHISEEPQQLNWYTRSDRFHPMETGKLTLEMTSPDYIRYFHSLPSAVKAQTLSRQDYLYKGINIELISAIYQLLYQQQDIGRTTLQTNAELQSIGVHPETHQLLFQHLPTRQTFRVASDSVVLATGYHPASPCFLEGIQDRVCFEAGAYRVNLNYSIDINGKEIFVQNAELHSHGFNAPDLGMGPYRNMIIINTLLGYEHYSVEQRVAFQSFNPIPGQ